MSRAFAVPKSAMLCSNWPSPITMSQARATKIPSSIMYRPSSLTSSPRFSISSPLGSPDPSAVRFFS
uniref:Uncharacterized protein n=1 Tax=Arundo donax TaxID=35708 RepID=A0A0A9D2P3_ARUDO